VLVCQPLDLGCKEVPFSSVGLSACLSTLGFESHWHFPRFTGAKGGLDAKPGSLVHQPHLYNTGELRGHNFLGHGKYETVIHYLKADLVGSSL
jgi:hypothetical protein